MPNEVTLGLGDPPDRRYLYVTQDDKDPGCCWYTFDRTSEQKMPVPQQAITGYITGLRLHEITTRYGPSWKLDIHLNAGHPYAVRSGIKTVFTRGIVLALAAIDDPERLKEPVTIVVTPGGDSGKVVFGRLYLALSGERVKAEWDKDLDLVATVEHLQTILGDGGGQGVEREEGDHEDQQPREPRPRETVAITNGNGNGPVRLPQPQNRPAGLATHEQIKELLRVGRSVGIAADDNDIVALALLSAESAKLHDGKSVEQLTLGEAIKFRQTLLSM